MTVVMDRSQKPENQRIDRKTPGKTKPESETVGKKALRYFRGWRI